MSRKKVRVSIVNYTNTLPFKWALKNSALATDIDLQEDTPSQCAQKLKNGLADLALVPVALVPELDRYFIETDFCIGANGKVDSVKLYSEVPLEKIKTVILDYQSRSSIALTRILFKFYWKREMEFAAAAHGFENEVGSTTAIVVIGDRTFPLNGKYAFEYDLAEEWKKFTALPFIFAAWVSTIKLPPEFITRFNDTLRHGVNNIEKAVEENPPAVLTKEQALFYLTKRIDYALDVQKLEAMRLFLHYMGQL